MKSMATESGIDVSAGAVYNGHISLKPNNSDGSYFTHDFVQNLINKYNLK